MKILNMIKATVEKKTCPKCGLPFMAVSAAIGPYKTKRDAHGYHAEAGAYETRKVCECK